MGLAAIEDEVGGYDLASRVTGTCKNTLYAWVSEGRIPHIRLSKKLVRFRRSALEAWMQERAVAVNPDAPKRQRKGAKPARVSRADRRAKRKQATH